MDRCFLIENMETEIFELNDLNTEGYSSAVAYCGELIRMGKTVVFPTETVYGLGANAFDEMAVKKIFEAKGRPGDNPLIVHVAEKAEVAPLVKSIPEKAKLLMAEFWPGPLTLIMPVSEKIPKAVTAGLDTVAVRMPSGKTAHELIAQAGVPIAAPSANISGRPSPTEGAHVLEDMTGKVSAILIADEIEVGLESTVVDMTSEPPTLLRPGGITADALRHVIGDITLSPNITENIIPEKVMSPGMKYRHYAPKGKVIIVRGDAETKAEKIKNEISRLSEIEKHYFGILATDETKNTYLNLDAQVLSLGSQKEPEHLGRHLFDRLRQFDMLGCEYIFAEDISREDETLALINRLYKSAGYVFI